MSGTQPDEIVDGNVAGNNYDKYASTNPVEQRMMQSFFAAFDRMLTGVEPATVVEVGAGEGRITQHLRDRFPASSVCGLDLPDDTLADEWRDVDAPMFFGDVTTLPFADRSIDMIVGLEMLEHVPNPDNALDEIARVCGATAILSVPREPIWRIGNMARGRYLRDLGNTPGHINHWSTRRFRAFVERRFEIVDAAQPLPWTMCKAVPRR